MMDQVHIDELHRQIHALSTPLMIMAYLLDLKQMSSQDMDKLRKQFDKVMNIMQAMQETIAYNIPQQRPTGKEQDTSKNSVDSQDVGNSVGNKAD